MITDTMKQVYLLAQENCGLKVGDWIKVTRKAEDYEGGWGDRWLCDMNVAIDKIGKVETIDKLGVFVYFGKPIINTWHFPYFVLEKVENPKHGFKPFDKVLVSNGNGDDWRCSFFSHMREDRYVCDACIWKQCIPYEGNEHLLGTTYKPEE